MSVPVWVPGQVLSASDINRWFVVATAIKPGNTSRASTITVTGDPDLTLPVEASAVYELEMLCHMDGVSGADLTIKFAVPAAATLIMINQALIATPANSQADACFAAVTANAMVMGCLGAGANSGCLLKGTLTTGVTAGSLTLQWAQNVSNATPTILHAGSRMSLARIG